MEPSLLFILGPGSKKTTGSSSIKSTFFGLIRYKNAKVLRDQSMALMKTSGFPVVLGYEFYPVVVRHSESVIENERQLLEQGYEIEEASEKFSMQIFSPGQLVIDLLIPLAQLKITEKDLARVIGDSVNSWRQQFQIPNSVNVQIDGINQIIIDQRLMEIAGHHMELKEIFQSWLNHFTAHLLQSLKADMDYEEP